MDKFTNYDEILLYALKIAENYFLEFDIGIDKTQEVKDRLFERIRFKIKDEYNITQLSNIDSQEKVKSIVYNITK